MDHTDKVNALIKNNKWFVINNYENVFKWLSNSFLTKFSNMDIDHDLDRSLSYNLFCSYLSNKKYVLNNYEEYRPILIEDIDWDNTDANTNSSDYICTLIKKKASLYQDLSELVTSFCDQQGNEIPKFSEIPITYDSETYSDIYTNEFTWDTDKLGSHTISFWATEPSTGNYIISLLYYPETGNPNNQNRVVTTLDFSYGDETMKRTINGTEYTFKKCFTDPFTVSTAGIYRFNIYTNCGIILLEEAYTYIYGKTLDTYNRELMDRNGPSIHTYKFALSPSTYDLVCYNIKKIVKYYFGTSQRFTLINLIYSILYNSSSLTTENVITNNNTLLFALIFDIYFSLSDKAETNDGKIIEDITKPIIIQQNWRSGEFTEVEPTEYWENNKECLLNETNYVLNAMYYDNKNINFYNILKSSKKNDVLTLTTNEAYLDIIFENENNRRVFELPLADEIGASPVPPSIPYENEFDIIINDLKEPCNDLSKIVKTDRFKMSLQGNELIVSAPTDSMTQYSDIISLNNSIIRECSTTVNVDYMQDILKLSKINDTYFKNNPIDLQRL